MSGPRASIIINNWNLDRFVGRAIDSALRQTRLDRRLAP
jgi:hypothetical protein